MGKYKQPYTLFKIATSKYWYYQGYNTDGERLNRRSTGQVTKAKAMAYLQEVYQAGGFTNQQDTKFGDFFKDYFIWDKCPYVQGKLSRTVKGKQGIKESTVRRYRNLFTTHILPYFNKLKINEITPKKIDKWLLSFIDKGLSGKTGNSAKSVLSILLEEAIDAGLIKENPCERTKPLIDKPKEKILINYNEAVNFFSLKNWQKAESSEQYRLLFITACCTGLRLGELLALRHCDVDIKDEVISVNGNYDTKATHKRTTPKNGESRIVPLPASLIKAITAINGFGGNHYIFSFYGNKPYSRTRLVLVMRDAAKLASVGEMPPHHWRAFFNTHLVQNNINPIKIKAIMGHANTDMTDKYTRFTKDQLSDVLTLQEKILNDILQKS
ncbi:MAG: site-specific integrase [Spirochaetaceae bacterium]|nr:site-specific integrase [Spirochaetaceae bacterium]